MKIVCVVPNPAAHDNRVVKGAESLRAAGHDVEIVGIKDRTRQQDAVLLDSGVTVHRVGWRAAVTASMTWVYLAVLAVTLAFAAGVVIVLFNLSWRLADAAPSAGDLSEAVQGARATVRNAVESLTWFDLPLLFLLFALLAVLARPARRRIARGWKALKRRAWRLADGVPGRARRYARSAQAIAAEEREAATTKIASFLLDPVRSFGDWLTTLDARIRFTLTQRARVRALIARIEPFAPDVVYCHEALSLPVGAHFKKAHGARLIYDAHEFYEDISLAEGYKTAMFRRIHAEHLPLVDAFFTVSDGIVALYAQAYPVAPRAVVIANAPRRRALPDYDGRLHEAADLPPDRRILLYQGGFSHARSLDRIVAAADHLPEGWSIVMMGSGAAGPMLESQIEAQGRAWVQRQLTKRQRAVEAALSAEAARYSAEMLERLSPLEQIEVLRDRLLAEKQETPDQPLSETMDDARLASFGVSASLRTALRSVLGAAKAAGDQSDGKQNSGFSEVRALLADWAASAANMRAFFIEEFYARELRKLAPITLRAYDAVRIVPLAPFEELAEWTCGATVGVIPYDNINLNHWHCAPNKLWEYPHAGVPVLATPMQDMARIIRANGIGWLLHPDLTPERLGRAVARLDPDDIDIRRRNCLAFRESESWERYEPDLVAAVEGRGSRDAEAAARDQKP